MWEEGEEEEEEEEESIKAVWSRSYSIEIAADDKIDHIDPSQRTKCRKNSIKSTNKTPSPWLKVKSQK